MLKRKWLRIKPCVLCWEILHFQLKSKDKINVIEYFLKVFESVSLHASQVLVDKVNVALGEHVSIVLFVAFQLVRQLLRLLLDSGAAFSIIKALL